MSCSVCSAEVPARQSVCDFCRDDIAATVPDASPAVRAALAASPTAHADVVAAAESALDWFYDVADRAGERRSEVVQAIWLVEDALDVHPAELQSRLASLNLIAAQVTR